MERVEIKKWTKTREVEEVKEDKKLNNDSDNVENLLNQNVDDDKIENIKELYDKVNNIRSVSELNQYQFNGEPIIVGEKVLRTIFSNDNSTLKYSFEDLYSWIGSSYEVNWKDEGNGSEFITWPSYSYHTNNNSYTRLGVEWRMLEGKFNLTEEQIDLIKNKKVQPVLGVSSNNSKGFETIIPFSDLINIFINKKVTKLNYMYLDKDKPMSTKYKINMDKQSISYINTNMLENLKFCHKESHEHTTSYIDNKHVDLNILNKFRGTNNYYKMYGDISEEILKYRNTKNEYELQALVGQLSKDGRYETNDYGGIGKLDLFLIENPQVEVNIKPYIIDKSNEKVYKDSKYKFSYNEKLYYDIEIINKSDSYDFTNLSLNLDFLEGTKVTESLRINKDDITYKGKSIKDNVKLYINDNKVPVNLNNLSSLKQNDKILISGDEINHIVSEYEGIVEKINYKYSIEFNYIDNYFFYKYENTNSIGVNLVKGRLTIIVDTNTQEDHYIRVSGKNNSANIKIKSKEPYTVWNLDYDILYNVSLIDSSSYKPMDQVSVTLNSNLNTNKETITLKPSPKSHKYFTQRKTDSIILNR